MVILRDPNNLVHASLFQGKKKTFAIVYRQSLTTRCSYLYIYFFVVLSTFKEFLSMLVYKLGSNVHS